MRLWQLTRKTNGLGEDEAHCIPSARVKVALELFDA
jgi:hypothetical protein